MRRAALIVAAIAGAYALAVSFIVLEYYAAFRGMGPALLRSAVLRAAMWVSVLPVTILATRPIVKRTKNVVIDAASLTMICFVAAAIGEFAYLAFAVGHGWYRKPGSAEQESLSTLLPTLLASIHAPFTFLICATMGTRWLAESADQHAAETRISRLETRLFEARAHLLRSQLHPHFLFNALNSVTALIRSEPGRASGMLDQLSRFYAIAAATEGRKTVPLGEELEFVRQYIDIEQIRFGPRLTTMIDVAPDVVDAEVPTLILQPLAENAIKHGISRQPGPGTLVITAHARRDLLSILIEDSGNFDPDKMRDGIGLGNTRERLQQLYGDRASVAIAAIDAGTRVTLTIPLGAAA